MNRSPYITDAPTVSTIMLKVLLALVPGIMAYTWIYGGGILVSLTLATSTAIIAEAALLKIRQRPIRPYLMDMSAVVTAWLLALALPPLSALVASCCRNIVCYRHRKTTLRWFGLQPI